MLGHSQAAVSEIYAERDFAKAANVARPAVGSPGDVVCIDGRQYAARIIPAVGETVCLLYTCQT